MYAILKFLSASIYCESICSLTVRSNPLHEFSLACDMLSEIIDSAVPAIESTIDSGVNTVSDSIDLVSKYFELDWRDQAGRNELGAVKTMKFVAFLFGFLFVQHVYADSCQGVVDSVLHRDATYGEKLNMLLEKEKQCSGDAYYALIKAQIYAKNRDFNKAIELIAAVEDTGKYRYDFVLLDAKAYMMIGKTDTAIAKMKAYLQDEPQNYKAHLFLGKLLVNENDFDEAVRSFIASINLKPTPGAYVELARALYIVDNCSEAIVAIEQAASLDKATYGNTQAMVVASRCYAKQGEFLVARNLLGVLLENNSEAENDKQFRQAIAMLRRDVKAAQESGDKASDANKLKVEDI